MEKRALLAFVLSVLVFTLYQQWVRYEYAPRPAAARQTRSRERDDVAPAARTQAPPVESPPPEGRGGGEIRVETDLYVAVFTDVGARLRSFRLKRYRNSPAPNSGPVEMISPRASRWLAVELQGPEKFSDEDLVYDVFGRDLALAGDARGEILFVGLTPRGETIRKRYSFAGSSYAIGIEVSVDGAPEPIPLRLLLTSPTEPPTKGAAFEGALALAAEKLVREPPKRLEAGAALRGELSWIGFGYTYFLAALLPDEGRERVSLRQAEATAAMAIERETPTAAGRGRYTLFIGPKDLDVLKATGRGLERAIDFGYFGIVAVPLYHALRLSHRVTGSYGIDIILLTVLIKLLLAPLAHRSYVSMKRMRLLQPQMERIKQRFKDDRDRLNREIMELYRRNKVNPLGGCLPVLLQIPILTGLYRALQVPIEFRHARFLWIDDLSRPDWESLRVAVGEWQFGIPVLTLLMGASMFAQQRWMTPAAQDPDQRQLALLTPALFTVMFINFPAGLTIYWLASNLLAIGQQYLVSRLDG